MRQKTQKWKGYILATLLFAVIFAILASHLVVPASGNDRYFAGKAEEYYQNLMELGFPSDYAVALTELHLLHPNWTFTPLQFTKQNSKYTWDYVVDQEYDDPHLNVIYSSYSYAAYHHPLNKELFDAGYYQVSKETLEYFMDPRNFLNETDIFQFYSLSGVPQNSIKSVESVLAGTFMEDKTLENGKTYAEYFVELGELLDVNPIFLATKVRQEQGVNGTSPLISGNCGSQLWDFYQNKTQVSESGNSVLAPLTGYTKTELLAFDGLYNYFNVKAMGNGLFEIYYNAMTYAQKGTPDMAASWGGSGAWNTRWKALYGGTKFLQSNYIGRYQSTVYLQKFNVDGRANDNFSHQYMASVFGAMSEARTLYQSFATLNLLDSPANFLIPVYDDMPSSPSPDPANGTCNLTQQATYKYSYQAELSDPFSKTAQDGALYLEQEVYPGDSLSLAGTLTHTYKVKSLEYAWDNGEWNGFSNGKSFNLSLPCDFLQNTSHILVIRGTATYQTASDATVHTKFLYAVVYVNVIPRPPVTFQYEVEGEIESREYEVGTQINLPQNQTAGFVGWLNENGDLLPPGAEFEVISETTFSALCVDFEHLEGASLVASSPSSPKLRFSAVMSKDSLGKLDRLPENSYYFSTKVCENGDLLTWNFPNKTFIGAANGKDWVQLDVLTDSLEEDQYINSFSSEFFVNIRYSNGYLLSFAANGSPSLRSAKAVALSALTDSEANYSDPLLSLLQTVAGTP